MLGREVSFRAPTAKAPAQRPRPTPPPVELAVLPRTWSVSHADVGGGRDGARL